MWKNTYLQKFCCIRHIQKIKTIMFLIHYQKEKNTKIKLLCVFWMSDKLSC